ncbi:DNA repair protein RecN [Marivirga lumbricoides]|uniref:DNA repair protein RecN n=1 Tax=Marivirga lumbricoides TaxID=1046115 RepID=A0ABQ1LZF2_9BACT|nr:DNA repair protein RecN [Marivirga lumbricoides]
MLQKLLIKNYALIKELDITPSAGLNTITGETGAGKSIMLGAVGLLIGKRADTKVLYEEDKKCVVEGIFRIEDYSLKSFFESEELDYEAECVIRREISASGKSRAFVNDTPVTLDVLKNLGNYLMDIHSQHETLLLGDQDFQLQLIDAYGQTQSLLEEYQAIYSQYSTAKKELKKFTEASADLKQEKDYHQFLFEELEKAQLKPNEQEELEHSLEILENGEFIQQKLAEAYGALDQSEFAVNVIMHEAVEALKTLQNFSPAYKELYERLNSAFIEAQDIAKELEIENNQFEHDPAQLKYTQDRLSLIYQLQQKHKTDSITELLKIKDELEEKLLAAENADGDLESLQLKLKEVTRQLNDTASKLSKSRSKHFAQLEKELKELLSDLGMTDATINITNNKKEADKTGVDDIKILFSANKGISPQPLKNVASGGEFSRLMFALKYIMADKIALPTIIFDEIDTGISGEIAIKMVHMMQRMAASHQVITISHLPQIAAKGKHHYFVYKDNSADKSVSKVKLLSEEERSLEIAKMIGGDKPSESAIQSARELLSN